MTEAVAWMEYPYWLLIGGSVLMLVGLIGLALQREAAGAGPADMANSEDLAEPEDSLTPVEAYNRATKEKRKVRWTENQSETKEPANDRAPATTSSQVVVENN